MRQIHTSTGRAVDLDLALKALADPIRRSLLETLGKNQFFCTIDGQSVDGICVQDLSSILDVPQSTISRHLSILRQSGWVGHQQKGVWHYYFCNQDTLEAVMDWLASLRSLEGGHEHG